MNDTAQNRDWFYWLMAVFTVFQLALGLLAVPVVLLDLGNQNVVGGLGVKFFTLLIILPAGLWVSFMVLRRNLGNITGFLLLLWANVIVGSFVQRNTTFGIVFTSLNWSWISLWMLPVYFPDGYIIPRRFDKPIKLIHAFMIVTSGLWGFLQPAVVYEDVITRKLSYIANPIYIQALEPVKTIADAVQMLGLLSGVLCTLTLVVRYRRSEHAVKQQIKWLLWVVVIIFIALFSIIPTGVLNTPLGLGGLDTVAYVVFTSFLYAAPFIAVGIAILRYRLYDIDIIIRRTMIYSVLSAILAAIYFGTVILVQQLFQSATGEVPDFAIVLSTLLIAALFTPVRRRVQAVIDRRFYRRKYDVEQTLAQFNQTLRDEVDMDTLKSNLLTVVNETMQPNSIRLWIKDPVL